MNSLWLSNIKALTAKTLLLIASLLGFAGFASTASAQDCSTEKRTVKWKSPDGYFSVEIPRELKKEDSSYPGTTLYGSKVGDCAFIVYVIRHLQNEVDRKRTFNERIDGLEFMLGGDDDHDFSEQLLKVGKFQANKIVYAEQNTQGLLVDAGDYIFVVGFTSKNRKDLNSKVANRFFKSFRVAPIIIDI